MLGIDGLILWRIRHFEGKAIDQDSAIRARHEFLAVLRQDDPCYGRMCMAPNFRGEHCIGIA
jgi:hypothetical protein